MLNRRVTWLLAFLSLVLAGIFPFHTRAQAPQGAGADGGNEEVAAVRAQLAAVTQPADLAATAKDLDTRLAAFGGAVEGRGGRGGGFGGGGFGGGGRGGTAPGAMQSFIALNNSFNTLVSMMQVGLDIAPTAAQIDTWTNDCNSYNATVSAWKKMQSDDLAAFNAELTRNNARTVTVTPTKLTTAACAAASSATPAKRR